MKICNGRLSNGVQCRNVSADKNEYELCEVHERERLQEKSRMTSKKSRTRVTSATETINTLTLAHSLEQTAPNVTFAEVANSSVGAFPYKQRIKHLLDSGTNYNVGAELVHGVSCCHDTQPSNNCTVWFSWTGNSMKVYGLGSHVGGSGSGNRKYEMLWFDGTNKKWTRPK